MTVNKDSVIIIFILLILGLGVWLNTSVQTNIDNRAKIEELNKRNDSLKSVIDTNNYIIDMLFVVDSTLTAQIANQKPKIIERIRLVDSSKKEIAKYTDSQLVASFNKRYPKDTTSQKLELAKPVLVSAAQDLAELDGAKDIIVIKDSTINLYEKKDKIKDSIINKHESNAINYKYIISNQFTQNKLVMEENMSLRYDLDKQKKKTKLSKIVNIALLGGIGYLILK